MTARELLKKRGKSLVGRRIWSGMVGYYPGGEAEVVEIEPDDAAPEIVFNVRHPTVGVIGIFEHEIVEER